MQAGGEEGRLDDCRSLMTLACCIPLRVVSVSLWFEIKRNKGKERMARYHTMRAFFHALSIFSDLFLGPRFLCLGVVLICAHLFTHNLLLICSTFQPEGRVKGGSKVDVEVDRYGRRIACLQPLLIPLLSCSYTSFVRKRLFPFCWATEKNN